MSEKFWILDQRGNRSAGWDKGNLWRESDYSDYSGDYGEGSYVGFGGPAKRLAELRVVLKTKSVPDVIWTVCDCLVQDRVLQMLREQGFMGFEARRARVRREADTTHSDTGLPTYWELLVTGWGGMARPESGIAHVPGTDRWEGHPDWSRIVDWDSWDGSDFFIVWPFAFTRLVSDRAAQFVREHKLTGVALTAPETCTRQYAHSKVHRVTPMRLRDHFPEERAREIGEPLGIY